MRISCVHIIVTHSARTCGVGCAISLPDLLAVRRCASCCCSLCWFQAGPQQPWCQLSSAAAAGAAESPPAASSTSCCPSFSVSHSATGSRYVSSCQYLQHAAMSSVVAGVPTASLPERLPEGSSRDCQSRRRGSSYCCATPCLQKFVTDTCAPEGDAFPCLSVRHVDRQRHPRHRQPQPGHVQEVATQQQGRRGAYIEGALLYSTRQAWGGSARRIWGHLASSAATMRQQTEWKKALSAASLSSTMQPSQS